jgi:hypothetical protein
MRRGGRCPLELKNELVDETPIPILSRLVGPDYGMGGPEKVLGCVPSRRLITASDVPALLAHTQMNPIAAA